MPLDSAPLSCRAEKMAGLPMMYFVGSFVPSKTSFRIVPLHCLLGNAARKAINGFERLAPTAISCAMKRQILCIIVRCTLKKCLLTIACNVSERSNILGFKQAAAL